MADVRNADDMHPVYTPEALRERADFLTNFYEGHAKREVEMQIWAMRVAANALEAALLGINSHPETRDWSDLDRRISAMRVVETIHSDMAERLSSS